MSSITNYDLLEPRNVNNTNELPPEANIAKTRRAYRKTRLLDNFIVPLYFICLAQLAQLPKSPLQNAIFYVGIIIFSCLLTSPCLRVAEHIGNLGMSPHRSFYQGNLYLLNDHFAIQDVSNLIKQENVCRPYIEEFLNELASKNLLGLSPTLSKTTCKEDAIATLFLKTREGTCVGYGTAILKNLIENPMQSCENLIDRIHFKDIYRFQLVSDYMHEIIHNPQLSFLEKKHLFLSKLFANSPFSEKQKQHIYNNIRDYQHLIFWAYLGLKLIHFPECNFIELDKKDPSNFRKAFNKELAISFRDTCLKTYSPAGYISLAPDLTAQKPIGHAIFFQFDPEALIFRFFDAASPMMGFYAFKTEEQFFKGFKQHINTYPEYKDGRVSFIFCAVKKIQQAN